MQQLIAGTGRLVRRPLIVIGIALLALAALVFFRQGSGTRQEPAEDEFLELRTEQEYLLPSLTATPPVSAEPTAPAMGGPEPIVVYVSGAVAKPGIVRLGHAARADDAVRAAGGPTKAAALSRINLAARVYDEQHLHVPQVGEELPAQPGPTAQAGPGAATSGSSAGGKLNINTAGVAELEALPRIGAATAQRIVDYRVANGPFTRPEDLMQVKGIGPAIYEAIVNLIRVDP